ncbi:MAG: MAPEG family protein [Bacteriovoracia bacterium]
MNLFSSPNLHITFVVAALLALVYITLSINVILERFRAKASFGVGTDPQHPLAVAARMHGNFAEYAPLFLILLLLAETHELPVLALKITGALFVVGRVSHAIGMRLPAPNAFRGAGMMCTFFPILILAVWGLVHVLV